MKMSSCALLMNFSCVLQNTVVTQEYISLISVLDTELDRWLKILEDGNMAAL